MLHEEEGGRGRVANSCLGDEIGRSLLVSIALSTFWGGNNSLFAMVIAFAALTNSTNSTDASKPNHSHSNTKSEHSCVDRNLGLHSLDWGPIRRHIFSFV